MSMTSGQQHAVAMLKPNTPEEHTLVNLFRELDALGERYRGDALAVPAIEHLGSAIIALFDYDTGRIEQSRLDQKVREIVQEAGGNAGNL